ncbi:GTPase [Acetobacter fallax]|uniref:DUF815 domain-containing protein n=1 Tax=Acetobacter fallax TaxID=1737473 RepID=A0ABX0KAE4_9PROT|nr:GTPase domain-containing protein [Acetobacter fallax]NHO32727.1 DUF815 domain-containing protein [Acetobacter fallax]NHO36289.1 DUF815 domain-containing protein [Acetobacter fallax]
MTDSKLDDNLSDEARKILEDFQSQTRDFYKKFLAGNNAANILICGKTGVGKSTLINAVFGDHLAKTGIGQPVTQGIELIENPPNPIRILDTKGLELADYATILDGIIDEVKRRCGADPNDYVHVAWLCISNDSARVEDAEIRLAKALTDLGLKVIVVLTKVRLFKDKSFLKQVEKILGPYVTGIVMTRGLAYEEEDEETEDDDGNPIVHRYKVKGLDDLISMSYRFIPEAQRQAFANVISGLNKTAKELREKEARSFVAKFSANNAIALRTIMLQNKADEANLMPSIISAMYIRICYIFGVINDGNDCGNDVKQVAELVTAHLREHREKAEASNVNTSIFTLFFFPLTFFSYLFRSNGPETGQIQELLSQAGNQLIDTISNMVQNKEETTIRSIFLRFGDASLKVLSAPPLN